MTPRSIPLRIAVATVGAWLFGWAAPGPLMGTDLTVRTVQRNSGTPVRMNPETAETVLYLQGNRRRTEESRVQRNPLWPGGPEVPFYEPRHALIESCDGGTLQAMNLDLDRRTTAAVQMSRQVTPEELAALRSQLPAKAERPAQPTVLHETTTVDTGERKQMFGYTARHVITTFKIMPLAGTNNVTAGETATDGWYIDLDTRISCDMPRREPAEGTTYSGFALIGGTVNAGGRITRPAPLPAPKLNLVKTTYIGKPETGFAIRSKVTRKMALPTTAGGSGGSEQLSVTETEVTQLSTNSLDPALFEMPGDFRGVTRAEQLRMPRPPVWAQWLAWGHSYWVRLTKSI